MGAFVWLLIDMPRTRAIKEEVTLRAEAERSRILHQDIFEQKNLHLYPLAEEAAASELSRFCQELWRMPNMESYFDRRHIANLRHHQQEAQHGFASLPAGGILEVLSIPAMPGEVMGFQIFSVFDPKDDADRGRFIGYAVWSLELGHAPFGHAESVRVAFDIFPPYREGRYRKVRFTNHEIYNISRHLLYHYKPKQFLVDARTQIGQPRTGEPLKRAIYYLKRGYYPPDQKALADSCLVRLAQGRRVGAATIRKLLRVSRSAFWIYPVGKYANKRSCHRSPK
jgi:hypothetical protein